MSDRKINIPIKGMHCRSCEILIEKSLSEISGVDRVSVDRKKNTAEISWKSKRPDIPKIEESLIKAGYALGSEKKAGFLNRNGNDYKDLGIALLFLLGIYLFVKNSGLTDFNMTPSSNSYTLPVVLLVGITAGLSTCMALIGGLILGISARHAERHPEATPLQKFRPHLFFNAGRIVGYAFLGGILGTAGSVIQISGSFLGILTIAIGALMLILGIKLTGIFPWLDNFNLALPKNISRFLGLRRHEKEYSHRGSFAAGVLTFFLPCGFTQAMQLLAVGSGNFIQGALIMSFFALGTMPGLLGIGGLTSAAKGIFAKIFFKFAGAAVIFMALFNISNGYNLMGWQLSSIAKKTPPTADNNPSADPNVTFVGGAQIASMTEHSRGYSPNKFTITKGVPVRWEIEAKDPYSCAASLTIPKLGISKNLQAGKNVIEFTAQESGRIAFSCSMGMYTGAFDVVDERKTTSSSSTVNEGTQPVRFSENCDSCDGETGLQNGSQQETPTGAIISNGKQLITTVYEAQTDIQPSSFTVRAGIPVRFEIDPQSDGYGCMSMITIPGLHDQPELLKKGEKIVMEFTPVKKGEYKITCSMGMVRGNISVK